MSPLLRTGRPYLLRLYTSRKYVYAQVYSTAEKKILFSGSTIEPSLRVPAAEQGKALSGVEAAAQVGSLIAARCAERGIEAVHWDRRPGQKYHGKFKSALDAMRGAGLGFNYSTLAAVQS